MTAPGDPDRRGEPTAVPAFDLGRAAARIEVELAERWRRLLADTAFIGGEEVTAFEDAFAAWLGAPGCVGVANGTDALILALRSLDLAPGDEVIVPAFTFVATGAAVAWLGATPVFADVEPATLNLDFAAAADRVSERTVGVIGVHLYGCPFDVAAARDVCDRHGLWLIEDAAQAHGARFGDRRVGTFGELATWSFYPSKNLGAFGDGGAVTGSDVALLDRVRLLANHGATGRYHHERIGTNSRLDAVQAAVLNCRLPLLDADNARRRELAERYREGLAGVPGVEMLTVPAGRESVVHQLTIASDHRDRLQTWLRDRAIGSSVHYPRPLHRQPAFECLEAPSLPIAERAAERVLCLPMFAELSTDEVDAVVSAIDEFATAQ